MLPVLFSIGSFSVSSFGFFLALAFLYGVFLVWRLSRAWDLDEEKILDLTLLTFLGGLIGGRIYFAIEHYPFFSQSLLSIFLVGKYPGFSFWGSFLGGWLTLYLFTRRLRIDFWQVADVGVVGLLGGLIIANLGCLLGGCNIGNPSNSFLAVPMVGVIGERLPVQAFEAIALFFVLRKIWSKATHFHLRGMIVSLSLIFIGIVKLLMEPLKQSPSNGYLFSVTLIILGLTIFYKIQAGKRTPLSDIRFLFTFAASILTDRNRRKLIIESLGKSWYNQKTAFAWRLKNLARLLRRSRVRFSHKES